MQNHGIAAAAVGHLRAAEPPRLLYTSAPL